MRPNQIYSNGIITNRRVKKMPWAKIVVGIVVYALILFLMNKAI